MQHNSREGERPVARTSRRTAIAGAAPRARLDRRTEIRQAALTLFSERGYHGTGMEDIGRLVGLRASSLYNHMTSKQELLAEIMVDTMEELLAQFAAVTAGLAPQDQLRAAMEAHVRYHATHLRDVRLGNREIASLEEPTQSRVRNLRHEYTQKWQGMIESGLKDGVFETPSVQLAAYALLEMGIGVSQWYREDGPLSLDRIALYYGEMALRQLGVSDGD